MTTELGDQTANSAPALDSAVEGAMCVEHCGITLSLSPERCIYLPASDKLILSDVHLGKEAVFQRHGMAIPDGVATADIARIAKLLQQLKPQELLILGDLVHALPDAREGWLTAFAHLVEEHSGTNFHVITGNHDKPGTHKLLPTSVHWHEELFEGNMHFTHYPDLPGEPVKNTTQTIRSDSSLRFAGLINK